MHAAGAAVLSKGTPVEAIRHAELCTKPACAPPLRATALLRATDGSDLQGPGSSIPGCGDARLVAAIMSYVVLRQWLQDGGRVARTLMKNVSEVGSTLELNLPPVTLSAVLKWQYPHL